MKVLNFTVANGRTFSTMGNYKQAGFSLTSCTGFYGDCVSRILRRLRRKLLHRSSEKFCEDEILDFAQSLSPVEIKNGMTDSIIHDYVSNQRRLLEIELRSEQEEEEERIQKRKPGQQSSSKKNDDEHEGRKSRVLANLKVEEWSIGLMGRTVAHLTSMVNDNNNNNNNNDSNNIGTAPTIGEEKKQSSKKGSTKNNKKVNSHLTILPAHRITVGDEVEIMSKYSYNNEKMMIQQQQNKSNTSQRKRNKTGGVVSAVTDSMISVALFGSNRQQNVSASSTTTSVGDDDDEEEESSLLGTPPLIIVPKSSVEVHKKMINALQMLKEDGEDHKYAGRIVRSVFEHNNNTTKDNANQDQKDYSKESGNSIESSSHLQQSFTPFNPNLDQSQIDAIKFCLQNQPISLIRK